VTVKPQRHKLVSSCLGFLAAVAAQIIVHVPHARAQPAAYVIHISVDGLRPDAITALAEGQPSRSVSTDCGFISDAAMARVDNRLENITTSASLARVATTTREKQSIGFDSDGRLTCRRSRRSSANCSAQR
jgi:hypothetical protein